MMSEREKEKELLKKVREKYPHVTDKNEIDKLLVVFKKKKLLRSGIGYLVIGVVFLIILNLLMAFNKGYGGTKVLLLIGGISMVGEAIRLFVKASKVDKNPMDKTVEATEIKEIDKAYILKTHGRKLRDLSKFTIIRECVYDKSDEMEVGISNNTWHEYELVFKNSKTEEIYRLSVNSSEYEAAFIGKEYYLVLTPFGDELVDCAVGAYDTKKYKLNADVKPYCQFDM